MTSDADGAGTAAALESIRRELRLLSDRVAALEKAAASQLPLSPPEERGRGEGTKEISEEILIVISAAIAAFLGKKPRIRQIRLVTPTTWAQQGRVTIQASHAVPHHRG